jgi:hypothetical protein
MWTRATVTGFLVSTALEAFAGPPIRTELVRDEGVPSDGFPSINAAVIAASNRFNPESVANNQEHVGGVLRCRGAGFLYTHGKGEAGVPSVRFSVTVRPGCELVALWHTHGARQDHKRYFSPTDTRTAESIGVPFYMANHTGALRVFEPGDRVFTKKRVAGSLSQVLPKGSAWGSAVVDNEDNRVRIATRWEADPVMARSHAIPGAP